MRWIGLLFVMLGACVVPQPEYASGSVGEQLHDLGSVDTELASSPSPVADAGTGREYRCKPVTRYESKFVTEYERKCGKENRLFGKSRYECKSVPVTRFKYGPVTELECGFESVTGDQVDLENS